MKKQLSKLQQVDRKTYKLILFAFAIFLDICLVVVVSSFLSDIILYEYANYVHGIVYYIAYCIIYFILFILLNIFLYGKLITKKTRTSYSVMKNFCTYKQLNELTCDEEFRQIIFQGIDKVYESTYWFVIGDVFIGKNFITSAYVNKNSKGEYCINFILIDGSSFCYTATFHEDNMQKIKRILTSSISQVVFFDNKDVLSDIIEQELNNKYKIFIEKNNCVSLVKKWNNDFDVSKIINRG